MNKNAIQRFAIWARTELISQVSQRAYQYDITADGYGNYDAEAVSGRLLTDVEKKQRQELIDQIRHKGYAQVMEEVAYTWFNRFIALRFMEVNNYLPSHIRVFSDASGAFKPEILANALHMDFPGLDMERVADLIEKNQTEDLYRYLLLAQCNDLCVSLPRMFENMGSYTELLLPNNILRQDGILGRMVADIPEEDWTDQVQIIGWLYQYYNTELKDDTFALLKKNVKITKERLPSATQLFTPDWIVRYMVENSLGRLWIEGHPDDELKAGWKYYLDEAEQEADVQAQLDAIREEYRTLRPQDIKVIDPCMGSGHILVYAFDVLVQIYKKAGFSERDAAQSILTNNLYGLDIDDRAAQLAYFAVMMKARQYDRRIFTRNIQPHVYAIEESNNVRIPAMWRLGPEQGIAKKLMAELKDAKDYGSIIKLSLTMTELAALRKRLMEIDEMSTEGNLMDMMESSEIVYGLLPLVEVAEVMAPKYEVVVTNPPYASTSGIYSKLADFLKANYPETKYDLFAAFIEKGITWTKETGFTAMITQQAWMFLSSYQKLRDSITTCNTLETMVQLGNGSFGVADFGLTTFVIRRKVLQKFAGRYVRLTESNNPAWKEQSFHAKDHQYTAKQSDFSMIPGSPIAYWVSSSLRRDFVVGKPLSSYAEPKQGMATMDNNRYLRMWYEVSQTNVDLHCKSLEEAKASRKKWFPYNKGGDYRKWYGNFLYLVNWLNDGEELKRDAAKLYGSFSKRIYNTQYFFLPSITWSKVSSGSFSARYINDGCLFDVAGCSIFLNEEKRHYFIGLLNSKIVGNVLSIISPTLNYEVGHIKSLPVITMDKWNKQIDELVKACLRISSIDWNAFETSWDFDMHPIVKKALSRSHWNDDGAITIEYVYKYVAQDFEDRFNRLKANEEELNRIFIDIYGLQDELTPEVEDKDVTVRHADLGRDIRSMISYAVGCMFGRYSLTDWGLAYAGGEWNPGGRCCADYGEFQPDKDNIIPICDDEYFDDDIVGRFVDFVKIVFGKETLEENLRFIADALGGTGTPREVIRNYFLNDFYADHLRIYQKRPIYWLFDSGKKNGCKALIYMHRYQSDLLARMRTDYVHEQQERYRTQLKHIGDAMDSASASERIKLSKQQKKLQEQALELQKYEEKVHHLADQNIKIDLDDGVKHNYALFEDVLAKIK